MPALAEAAARPGAPLIRVQGDGRELALPGDLWPAGCPRARETPVFFEEISKTQANDLITRWGHPLGPYSRPFGYRAWGLAIDGTAAAVAVSGSTVGATSAGYKRNQVVDLARIARNPDHPGILRILLRLWRDYLAPRWDTWDLPVQAAVSYALPGKEGNLYRFDGWKFHGYCKPWSGGATWSAPSKANQMADGVKRLYVYEYPSLTRDVHAMLGAAGFIPGTKPRPKKRDPGASGFRVISTSPNAARVRYYSASRASADAGDQMLAAYARAAAARGYAVAADHGTRELIITQARARQAA